MLKSTTIFIYKDCEISTTSNISGTFPRGVKRVKFVEEAAMIFCLISDSIGGLKGRSTASLEVKGSIVHTGKGLPSLEKFRN